MGEENSDQQKATTSAQADPSPASQLAQQPQTTQSATTSPEKPKNKESQYKPVDPELVWAHYNRPEILKIMVKASVNKEVVGSFGGTGYAKRPNIIENPGDILAEVKGGVTSFHASEELWSNALSISTDMTKTDLSKLRVGFDLLLDIDCKEWEYSKIAADIVFQALRFFGVGNVGCKFSGNHGFHFIVPFESFPKEVNGIPTRLLFPEAARAIADYLTHLCGKKLSEELIKFEANQGIVGNDLIKTIAGKAGLAPERIKSNDERIIDGFAVVAIDTILITSRHLYRQVYSINEKSGRVSLPINPEKIMLFDRKIADIENLIVSRYQFLDRTRSVPNEAADLIVQSYDYATKKKHDIESAKFVTDLKRAEALAGRAHEEMVEKIPAEFFPDIIKKMFGPLDDGKKRAMFTLMKFLRCCNYSNDEIVVMMTEWNKKHPEPLRDTYFQGQIKYFVSQTEKILPSNYENSLYKDITGMDPPTRSKNPLADAKWAYIRYRRVQEEENKPKRKKKKDKEQQQENQENEQQKTDGKKEESTPTKKGQHRDPEHEKETEKQSSK